ncbi:hypothetical protein [Nocardia jejuensis]|uniref:hypothetical protein n=1 Tax=Nocardia jejuensis TaxID=328049 RepID=UPI00083284EB|nr:hypothetical protein [Nocardia jejuensis]
MTGPQKRTNWVGLGITGVVIGLIILGISTFAARDAENPRCDGHSMSAGDTCVSSRSGAQSTAERASDAEAASVWMQRVGYGLLTIGMVSLVVGGIAAAARPESSRRD